MSTRSATIIRQTTYWGEQAETEEIMRFYRHCDGYPEGHGMDMARAIENVDRLQCVMESEWLSNFLNWFLIHSPYTPHIEFEHQDGFCERVQPNSLTFLGSKELFNQYDWTQHD